MKKVVICPDGFAALTEKAIRMLNIENLMNYVNYVNDTIANPEKYLEPEETYEHLNDENMKKFLPTYEDKLNFIRKDNLDLNGNIYAVISDYDIKRDDERLIKVVEELGEEAYPILDKENPYEHKLVIIEIPDDVDFRIGEFECSCGERIVEGRRAWRYDTEENKVVEYKSYD